MANTLVVNTLANLGAIIINIYLLFKVSDGFVGQGTFKAKQIAAAIVCETVVGMLLMNFSYVVYETRFDLRFLLYAFSMKYLGWKVTVPTMFNLALGRFLFEVSKSSWLNLYLSFFLMVTLTFLHAWAKRRLSDKQELILSITYLIVISFLFGCYLTGDIQKTTLIYIVYGILAYTLAFFLYSILNDMQRILDTTEVDLSIALIDIDHFKNYNDRYGHRAGDVILQEIARIFSTYCTASNPVYRIGGEEFAILIQGDAQAAAYLLQKIQKRIRYQEIILDAGDSVSITLSIGIAQRQRGELLMQTQERADQALYRAKRSGRDQLCLY